MSECDVMTQIKTCPDKHKAMEGLCHCVFASQYGVKAEVTHVLVGFEDLAVIPSPLGGELTSLAESGRRPIRARVTQVIHLFLDTLHALKVN